MRTLGDVSPVVAAGSWRTNADMIGDVARLGYISGMVLDAAWGRGGFWTRWAPEDLTYHDLYTVDGVDFRNMPHDDATFDTVVFDPPYKLNGTPAAGDFDNRYGVDVAATWEDRMLSIGAGFAECARVLKPGGYLLAKCQDQVCSGQVRWQTDALTGAGPYYDLFKVDSFNFPSYRPQPPGRRQVHARRNFSTLLVFRKS